MELTLSENIRKFRKERKLTQEQLSEVLGVTSGAVYKWESGMSVPELGLIVEMADFFDTSVDVLLGYKMKDNQIDSSLKRIHDYSRQRDPRALEEAEKALKKYPNSFEVVHGCAQVYELFSVGSKTGTESNRALELFERSRLLIGQNTDPRISEITIWGEIATQYVQRGELEKSLEIYKSHNSGGIFDNSIGSILALFLKRYQEAEPYLAEAMLQAISVLFDTVVGYVYVFCARGEYKTAQELLEWWMAAIRGLKKENIRDFTDKCYAILLVLQAYTLIKAESLEEASALLEQAKDLARQFDAAPDYGVTALRYTNLLEDVIFSDSLGATAAESLEKMIDVLEEPKMFSMWKEAGRGE